VENFPTAAQKVFGPGTPKDQEKFGRLLHGSHLNAASINEGGYVFLDAGLQQQLCSCHEKK